MNSTNPQDTNPIVEAQKLIERQTRHYKEKLGVYWVTRKKGAEFSNETITKGTLANLDSIGEGPKGKFKLGRDICYPIDSFADFLIRRLK